MVGGTGFSWQQLMKLLLRLPIQHSQPALTRNPAKLRVFPVQQQQVSLTCTQLRPDVQTTTPCVNPCVTYTISSKPSPSPPVRLSHIPDHSFREHRVSMASMPLNIPRCP